jgi:hypothetical protein
VQSPALFGPRWISKPVTERARSQCLGR